MQGVQPTDVNSSTGTLYNMPLKGTGVGLGLGDLDTVDVKDAVAEGVGVTLALLDTVLLGLAVILTVLDREVEGVMEGVIVAVGEREGVAVAVGEREGVGLTVVCQQLAEEAEPVALVMCPAGQGVHATEPVALVKVERGQAVHCEEDSPLAKLPAAQGVQVDVPVVPANDPGAQGRQPVEPGVLWYRPTAHRLHVEVGYVKAGWKDPGAHAAHTPLLLWPGMQGQVSAVAQVRVVLPLNKAVALGMTGQLYTSLRQTESDTVQLPAL